MDGIVAAAKMTSPKGGADGEIIAEMAQQR
jgi:hypothetical protein